MTSVWLGSLTVAQTCSPTYASVTKQYNFYTITAVYGGLVLLQHISVVFALTAGLGSLETEKNTAHARVCWLVFMT